jgi:hypothetical protein
MEDGKKFLKDNLDGLKDMGGDLLKQGEGIVNNLAGDAENIIKDLTKMGKGKKNKIKFFTQNCFLNL